MEPYALFISILFSILIIIIVVLLNLVQKYTIMEYQRGLVYKEGKFLHILEPGGYWLVRHQYTVQYIDIRTSYITIQGQDLLSADNIGVRVSLIAGYNIEDPYLAMNKVVNYRDTLYQMIQLRLRDLIGAIEIEALLKNRDELNKQLYELSKPAAEEIGLHLSEVSIRDIMFSGELKNIFAQVVNAKFEGLAALERARGESAALRNLANGAKVLENNPALLQLRTLQTIEKSSGNTFVFTSQDNPLIQNGNKKIN